MTHLFDTNPAGRHFIVSRRVDITPSIPNIVQNGGFEQGGLLWGVVGSSNPFVLEESNPLVGNISLRTSSGSTILLQSKSNQPFATVIDGSGNIKLNAIKRFDTAEDDLFLFSALGEDFLNELVAVGFYEWDHRGDLINAEFVLTFKNPSLPSGTGEVKRRVGYYRTPPGVLQVTPFIWAGFNAVVPQGALFDDYSIKKLGSNDNLLLNSDFEEGGKYWTASDTNVSIEEVDPLLGKKSIKIISDPTRFMSASLAFDSVDLDLGLSVEPVPVKPGQIYRMESTGRGQADHMISARVQPVDADGLLVGFPAEVISLHIGTDVTTDFGFYTVPIGVNFLKATTIVAPDASAPRNFYIDEIDLRLVESTTTERLDETKIVDGYWSSPQLNRSGDMTHRLVKLFFLYLCAEDCTAEVELTSDGGRSWTKPRVIQFTRTSDSVRQKLIGQQVTGHDIRFRINFNNKLISFFGYRAEMYPAGHLVDVGE